MIFPDTEVRWLKVPDRVKLDGATIVQEYKHVLQYRTRIEVTDYGSINPSTNDYVRRKEWSPWLDVPVVDT